MSHNPLIMPMPKSIEVNYDSHLKIDSGFQFAFTDHRDPRLEVALARFAERLSHEARTEIAGAPAENPSDANLIIACAGPSEPVQKLGEDETYTLEVTETKATLTAPKTLGVLRGLETLLLLTSSDGEGGYCFPLMQVADSPRFPWRGYMLDCCRHFMPLDLIKRHIESMAMVKLNIFHWHLSEDQGFRIECKSFPKLHEMGSDGLYYTHDQVKEIVAYAHDRGIRVVPEFDMPGHTTAWFVGCPGIASAPGPYVIERKWGVFHPTMDASREETYQFLDTFLGEMTALFPDEFFHIGGDEVEPTHWNTNPNIQAFMKANNLADPYALQAYFNRRVQAILKKYGKRMAGWDEILHPDLPNDIMIQSWRGRVALASSAKQGYDTILSNGYYLSGPAAHYYANDPIEGPTANLSPEEEAHILGGEACMWSEHVGEINVDGRVWPLLGAIAERLWSPATVDDPGDMLLRLNDLSVSLDYDWLRTKHFDNELGVLARWGKPNGVSVMMFAHALKPAYYPQHMTDATTPLDTISDILPAESGLQRGLLTLVLHYAKAPDIFAPVIRERLTEWQKASEEAIPTMEKSPHLAGCVEAAHVLDKVCAVGLEALDYLLSGKAAPADWKSEQLAYLESVSGNIGDVRIGILDPVGMLVERVS